MTRHRSRGIDFEAATSSPRCSGALLARSTQARILRLVLRAPHALPHARLAAPRRSAHGKTARKRAVLVMQDSTSFRIQRRRGFDRPRLDEAESRCPRPLVRSLVGGPMVEAGSGARQSEAAFRGRPCRGRSTHAFGFERPPRPIAASSARSSASDASIAASAASSASFCAWSISSARSGATSIVTSALRSRSN